MTTYERNNNVGALLRHDKYYLPDGNLYLLVENTLFRVHSYFLTRESVVFRQKLETSIRSSRDQDRSSDSNAIRIKNVTPEQVAQFLWIFYDPKYSRVTTVEHWTVILNLAHKWGFAEIKALAIHSLEKLDFPVVRRIAIYQQYDVSDDILRPHYATLCSRRDMLTSKEVNTLGLRTTLMIFSVREKLLTNQAGIKPFNQIELAVFEKAVGSFFVEKKKEVGSRKRLLTKRKGPCPK